MFWMVLPRNSLEKWAPWLIFAWVFIVFLPVIGAGFVNLDDGGNFLNNPHFRGLDWARLRWMLTPAHQEHFQPLSWLTLALDYTLWGMNPAGFHLTNLLIHGANAVLFYFISLRLIKAAGAKVEPIVAAALAALLFGLHPLRVESVAWVTERRDVLSGFFYLLTVLGYLRGVPIGWTLAVYLMALLSKSMTVSLPVALLVLDVYPLKRLRDSASSTKALKEKIPFAILALAAAAIAIGTHVSSDKMPSLSLYTAQMRLCVAAHGLVFYLWKSLLPFKLFAFYPLPKEISFRIGHFALCGTLTLALSLVFIARRRAWPGALAAWFYYALTLFPVLGLVGYLPHLGADRYSYLSCLGWAVLASVWLLGAGAWLRLRLAAAGLTLTLMSFLTWRQTFIWKDSESLWGYMATDPGHGVAQNALGIFAMERGDSLQAAERFKAALSIDPDFGAAHNNLGGVLSAQGRLDEALQHYREALRTSPDHWAVNYNIASILMAQGKRDEALAYYREELRINPSSEKTREALARFGSIRQ